MGESDWNHGSWVSTLGKFAWIVLLVMGILGIIVSLVLTLPAIALWEAARAAYALIFPGSVYPVAMPIGGLIWDIIGGVVTIILAFFIIRPKFSKPCGAKDWEALYGWALKLGGTKIPWMLIWGLILVIFGWYYWPGLLVLVPAIMLIFAGPRKYEWSAEK